jgi:hypothetical protein
MCAYTLLDMLESEEMVRNAEFLTRETDMLAKMALFEIHIYSEW